MSGPSGGRGNTGRGSAGRLAAVGGVALLSPAVLLLSLGVLGTTQTGAAAAVTGCGPVAVGASEPPAGVITDAQMADAAVAYTVAHHLGLPDRAALVATDAGLAESGLNNLDHGDLDSLGIWQERPSQGWGTPAQVLDPVYAATTFYAHLVAVPGWQRLPVDQAAQAVEASGHPDAYTPFVALATRWVATENGTAACTATDGSEGIPLSTDDGGLPPGFVLPAGTPAAAVPAIAFAVAQLGKPYLYGGTGPDSWDCSALVQAAYRAAGITLPRVTSTQVLVGTPVFDQAQMLPGDLVFIAGSDGTDAVPGHVGMYIGSGLVLHAPYTGQHVRADPVAGWPIVAIRRYA